MTKNRVGVLIEFQTSLPTRVKNDFIAATMDSVVNGDSRGLEELDDIYGTTWFSDPWDFEYEYEGLTEALESVAQIDELMTTHRLVESKSCKSNTLLIFERMR